MAPYILQITFKVYLGVEEIWRHSKVLDFDHQVAISHSVEFLELVSLGQSRTLGKSLHSVYIATPKWLTGFKVAVSHHQNAFIFFICFLDPSLSSFDLSSHSSSSSFSARWSGSRWQGQCDSVMGTMVNALYTRPHPYCFHMREPYWEREVKKSGPACLWLAWEHLPLTPLRPITCSSDWPQFLTKQPW